MWFAAALGVAAGGCRDAPAAAPDLVAVVEQARGASLVVLDLARDSVLVAVRADTLRPAPGLSAFVTALAAESLSPEARRALRPASALNARRLPGLEPPRRDTASWSLDRLLDAALAGDRAAADEALATVGRRAVEAAAPGGVEAPLPVGGLWLAWAPSRRGRDASPDTLAAAFLALPRAAQRDSAFFRDRAFLNSAALRAVETMRLEREGLGLSPARHRAAAAATLPRASARATARLLAEHPALRARLAALAVRDAPARTAVGRSGPFGAAACLSADGERLGVLFWDETLALADPLTALAERVRNPIP